MPHEERLIDIGSDLDESGNFKSDFVEQTDSSADEVQTGDEESDDFDVIEERPRRKIEAGSVDQIVDTILDGDFDSADLYDFMADDSLPNKREIFRQLIDRIQIDHKEFVLVMLICPYVEEIDKKQLLDKVFKFSMQADTILVFDAYAPFMDDPLSVIDWAITKNGASAVVRYFGCLSKDVMAMAAVKCLSTKEGVQAMKESGLIWSKPFDVDQARTLLAESIGQEEADLLYLFILNPKDYDDPEKCPEMENEIKKAISRFGIDGDSVYEAWKASFTHAYENKATEKKSYSRVKDLLPKIQDSLEMMREIEETHPGAVKVLHEEFGISDFARYSKDMMISQYEQRDDAASTYGVYVMPRGDWNGAFYRDVKAMQGLADDLASENVKVRFIETGKKTQLYRRLLRFDQKYNANGENKINFMVLCGHGSPTSISFDHTGKAPKDEVLTTWDIARLEGREKMPLTDRIIISLLAGARRLSKEQRSRRVMHQVKSFCVDNMDVATIACSNADPGVENNMTKALSSQTGSEIEGMESSGHVQKINSQVIDGKVRLNVDYSIGKGVYAGGEQV